MKDTTLLWWSCTCCDKFSYLCYVATFSTERIDQFEISSFYFHFLPGPSPIVDDATTSNSTDNTGGGFSPPALDNNYQSAPNAAPKGMQFLYDLADQFLKAIQQKDPLPPGEL